MTFWQWARDLWKRFVMIGAMSFPWAGALFAALAAGFTVHSWLLLRNGIHAQATITENVAVQSADGTVLYQTHGRLRLPSGEVVTFVDPVETMNDDVPSFAPGTVVPVVYAAGRPNAAVISTTWRVYFGAILCGVLSVVFIDLGILLRRLRQHRLSA